MKKKHLFFAAMASLALASCINDEIVTNTSPTENTGDAIVFSSISKGMTRADFKDKAAAEKLNNTFVVSGYKGPKSTWDATDSKLVFDNYTVKYAENTAQTSASNSDNWDYVGIAPNTHAAAHGITSQTIKFWDYSTAQYDFIAWSTGTKTAIFSKPAGGIPAGSVLVSAITPSTATGTGTDKVAYTFEGKAEDLAECYIADLVTVKKANYQQPVTLSFRQLGTKVRIGIYETIPGYSVKDVKFYSAAANALADETTGSDADKTAARTTNAKAKLFTTTTNSIFTKGKYTVTFPNVDKTTADAEYTDNNQAHVSFSEDADQSTYIDAWSSLNYTTPEGGEKTTGNAYLGRSSDKASFAGTASKNYYEVYLPNEDGTNLNLRVNYTLEATDGSGEVIEVKGATAQVPSIYAQWKPGYAYTYLFKISDKTNGTTGVYDPTNPDNTTINSDPTGLYPITFDAVVVNAEDNDKVQETITTVSAPSITTYQKGSTVVNKNEYLASTGDIYVTVNDGATENTPDLAHGALQDLTGKATLYTITSGKTEADVVDALTIRDDYPTSTLLGRNSVSLTSATLTLTNKVEFGVDGNAISVGTNEAAKFTPQSEKTYAFVYTKKAPTTYTDKYEPVTKATGTVVTHLYRDFNLTAASGDAKSGKSYRSITDGVISTETAFLGQTVGNLYKRTGGTEPYTYESASGYAATGTTYYYKTGGDYIDAQNIAYEDFETADLYHDNTQTEAKTETTPTDGQAYYTSTGKYCVILPQQVDGWYEYTSGGYHACFNNEKALAGHAYFDHYIQNNGEYYTKVIKVQ